MVEDPLTPPGSVCETPQIQHPKYTETDAGSGRWWIWAAPTTTSPRVCSATRWHGEHGRVPEKVWFSTADNRKFYLHCLILFLIFRLVYHSPWNLPGISSASRIIFSYFFLPCCLLEQVQVWLTFRQFRAALFREGVFRSLSLPSRNSV